MRSLGLIAGLWLGLMLNSALAGSYELTDGTRLLGDPTTYEDGGVILRTGEGTYLPITPWGRFTQDALKQLLADATTPLERKIVEPMLQVVPPASAPPREIVVTPIETPARPTGHLGVLAIFTSPMGWVVLLILYGANLFAAYEVALYRNQPVQSVCGLAAIPFFGLASPIFYLASPGHTRVEEEEPGSVIEHGPIAQITSPAAGRPKAAGQAAPPPAMNREASPPPPAAAPAPPPADLPAPIVYQRGDFSFNRRFFETKLPGFFRVVLSEADKDMVIKIKSSRGNFVGKRIPRITPTELYLQIFKEGASADEMIPFGEILEVQVCHQDLG